MGPRHTRPVPNRLEAVRRVSSPAPPLIGVRDPDKVGGLNSESAPTTPKILVAVQDEAVRQRLRDLLGTSDLALDVLDPENDPLEAPPRTQADLIVVRRSDVDGEDLRLVDAFTKETSTPGLVVLTEQGDDADRARLMAAGASSVLDSSDSNRELRTNLEAIAEAEHQGSSRGPHSAGENPQPLLADFLSRSTRMKVFVEFVQRVVDTDSSLLITGETGVGKERLAQAIHNEGPRRRAPFVSVNCGAIPEQLLESELFGHEAGAFTGANQRKKGRFEQANGGTIFLDEIGEMPLHLQVSLLTVLQRRRVQRVGSEDTIHVDVRVMAATNRDLEREIRRGRFRQDLYYRLNVVNLDIPSLRDRSEDIPDLTGRFINHFRESLGRPSVEGISDEALGAMTRYDWPGNIRELVNAVEHAVILCQTKQITLGDLPDTVAGRRQNAIEGPATPADSEGRLLRDEWLALPLREARRRVGIEFEREYLEAQLIRNRGKVGETARRIGIGPRSLYDKMRQHGLKKEDYREA